MVPCLEFGSIKSRCLKLTDKNNFLRLFVLFTGYYTGSVNSLLGTSIKTGPVFPQLILYFQRGLGLLAGASTSPCCVFTAHFHLIRCFFFCSISVPSLAQLCHFFLSSRNRIGHLTSSHRPAKLHVFFVLDKMIQALRVSWKYFFV